jgi:hypothetical protein
VYEGNYDYYVERSARYRQRPTKKKVKPRVKKEGVSNKKKGRTAEACERDIETTEARIAELTETLGMQETYADAEFAAATVAEYDQLQGSLAALYEEWEEIYG